MNSDPGKYPVTFSLFTFFSQLTGTGSTITPVDYKLYDLWVYKKGQKQENVNLERK